jgi:hypothetical protein
MARPERSLGGLVRHDRSPPCNCSHEALPFVEAAAKAKLAAVLKLSRAVISQRFSADFLYAARIRLQDAVELV